MNDAGQITQRANRRRKALFCALAYLVISAVWFIFSGNALDLLVEDAEIRSTLEVSKGLLFIGVTSVALYLLLRSWRVSAEDFVGADEAKGGGLKAWFLPAVYFLAMLLVISLGGCVAFEKLRQIETDKVEQSLAAVAKLKVAQIEGWNKQNTNYAFVAGNGSYLSECFEKWRREDWRPGANSEWVRKRLGTLRQSFPYGELTLVDMDGQIRMTTGGEQPALDHLRPLLRQVVEFKRPAIGNMHWHEQADGARPAVLYMAAPLLSSGIGGRVSGVLLFNLNPDSHLFPLIQLWPTHSASVEVVVFRRDGDDMLYFNELRHRKGDVGSRWRIADNPELLPVRVLQGETGFVGGSDYRGVPVIGYALGIPDTDWMMLAKVDAEEIHQPIRQLAINVALTAVLLALIGSLSLYFWWRQKRAQYRTVQLQAELKLQALDKHYVLLSKYANDIILLFDEKGNIIDANDRAEIAYRCARSDLVGSHIRKFRHKDEWDAMAEQWHQMAERR